MQKEPIGYTPNLENTARKFGYSAENPPPLDVLESKMFAVHSTAVLPKAGVLVAGTINPKSGEVYDDSFRPTLHFSLGEVVQGHRDRSWNEKPYAVVSPLKALSGQLMNLFPQDTFILGNYRLGKDDVLLVPRGTDVSALPDQVNVVDYNPDFGLRMAVDQVIRDKNGWPVRMQPEGVNIGSVAMIDDVDINDANFFSAMYEKYPYVSYGVHLTSERGEAFRFGATDMITQLATKGYDGSRIQRGTVRMQYYRAFIDHHLTRLTDFLNSQNLPTEAMSAFEQKSAYVRGWLNVIDVDLEMRERHGKTLSGADNDILEVIKAKKNSIEELREVTDSLASRLPKTLGDDDIRASVIAEQIAVMPLEEAREFIQNNENIFSRLYMPAFYANYAIRRWILEKDKAAREQGFDRMLQQALQQTDSGALKTYDEQEPVFDSIVAQLTLGTNRLQTVLNILQEPYVKEYLQRIIGITFPDGEPTTLESVLRAHPKTAILFNPSSNVSLTDESLGSFFAATVKAFEIEYQQRDAANEQ